MQQALGSAVADAVAAGGSQMRTGPDCVTGSPTVSGEVVFRCVGTTTDGLEVAATAEGGSSDDLDKTDLTVKVGGEVVYSGSVEKILAEND